MLIIRDIANELICDHKMREIKIISILIISNSSKDRG